jgi:hypothetical protein
MSFVSGNGWLGMDHNENNIPTFDSCGHAVHVSCYNKTRRINELTRIYTHCPLCSASVNILIPQKERI